MDEIIFLQVFKALAYKFSMFHIRVEARAVVLGQKPALLIPEITLEKGPGPADIRFVAVYLATLVLAEENAAAVLAFEQGLIVMPYSVFGQELVPVQAQCIAKALHIQSAQHYAPFALAALSTHPALKSIIILSHG
jgi:hypothetical protein